jgi:hypothetical protein
VAANEWLNMRKSRHQVLEQMDKYHNSQPLEKRNDAI